MATDCLLLILPLLAETDPRALPKLETSTWIALVIGALATMFIMVRAKTRRNKDPLERSQSSAGLAQQRTVERQMSNLLVELSEMSRGISAGLDTRAAKLEALLEEADRKIAQLQALAERTSVAGPSSANGHTMSLTTDRDEATMPTSLPGEADPRYERIYSLADEGRSVPEIASAVELPSGEIELILALRTRRAS
jgi:hypothetical protein